MTLRRESSKQFSAQVFFFVKKVIDYELLNKAVDLNIITRTSATRTRASALHREEEPFINSCAVHLISRTPNKNSLNHVFDSSGSFSNAARAYNVNTIIYKL